MLHSIAERIKRRGLVIVISDLIDDEAKIASGLQHFRHDKHEVVVFHVMDDAELTFPWDRITRFKDMEGHGRVVTNPNSLRARYLTRLGTFLDGVKTACFERVDQLQPGRHQRALRGFSGGLPGEASADRMKEV